MNRREFMQSVAGAALTTSCLTQPHEVTVRISDEELVGVYPADIEQYVYSKLRNAGAPISLLALGDTRLLRGEGSIIKTRLFDSRFTQFQWRAS
jgi:hypothetical protein